MTKNILLGVVILSAGGFLYMNNDSEKISNDFSSDAVQTVAGNDRTFVSEEKVSEDLLPRSDRSVTVAAQTSLPLPGSAPAVNVSHNIPLEEVRRGCFRQDCIPSVDKPEFITIEQADQVLPDDTVGIALEYKDQTRFYPFNMLVTKELVNDVVADDPLLITYCPLCGTGVVYERVVDGVVYEFGVSGMLWQSNLLMYNRAEDIADRNLWSQVLGEAVIGAKAGAKLTIVPSDIVKYVDWKDSHPGALVLNTGSIGDPYDGNYYGVALNFEPDFDEATSSLAPTDYVYGVQIGSVYKAYPDALLPVGTITDTVEGTAITITKSDTGQVTIQDAEQTTIPDVEGFWFSWKAAHPTTLLWTNS